MHQRKSFGCTDCQLTSWRKDVKTSNTNHLLRLSEHNTPHSESSLSCVDETHWGTVSSHSGARNREEARSPEDRHRGEHHWLPNEATPRITLWNTKKMMGLRQVTEQMRVEWGPEEQRRKHKGLKKQHLTRSTIARTSDLQPIDTRPRSRIGLQPTTTNKPIRTKEDFEQVDSTDSNQPNLETPN